jgi:hypothetical protein
VREGHIAPDKHPMPDEWADAPEEDAELVHTERCGRERYILRVAQSLVPLKGSPRYLALSMRGHSAHLYTHGMILPLFGGTLL